nr:hypothetical protein [Tanacetum cinerariifolium]
MDIDDVQDEKADVGMTDAQQEKENLEITQEQVIEDAHVTIKKKTEVPVTISSRSSNLASKFLKFLDIPPVDIEIVSPLDVYVHHEVPRIHTSTLLAVPVLVILEASPVYTNIPQSSQTFTSLPLHVAEMTRIKMKALLLDQTEGTKSQPKSSGKSVHAEEPELQVGDTDTPQGQEGNQDKTPQKGPTQNWLMTLVASTSTAFRLLKGTRSNYTELEYNFEECYKALSEKLDWENPKGGDYPFDLSKPLPLITCGNHQSIPVEFFINNDLKYLQGGILTMTYMTFTAKTKATQYDLPGNEDVVPNIWSPVKVAYDKYALWGISHWRDQRKTFYTYARGIQSRGDVYSTKRILAVTHVSIIRKHGYGYLEEIVVRRADNALYKFKKGDFLRLRINNIKDMLLPVVQNRLVNLLGADVADFAIALRMFTRSLVIQKLLSSLEDITKNINMEYLPKRRWSTLEKKRAHYMIKYINKLLKERRMMRSLEKFVGGRLYGTDLRLLQRTI